MSTKLIIFIFLLIPVFVQAQYDIAPGQSDEPYISYNKIKVYNPFGKHIGIYVRYENGGWEELEIEPEGFEIIELDICGKPAGTNCLVTLRMYSNQKQFREVNVNGGSRYMIRFDANLKQYYFEEIR